jgi:hypothetical protein
MAIGPIDYMGGMPQVNLAQQFTQGLQAGAAVEQLQVARQQREAQMQAAEEARMRQEAFRNNFSAYLEKPTARGWAALVAENPGMREALGDINKTLSAEQARAEQKDALELYNALNTDPAVAAQILDSRIEAARNSGLPTQELEAIRARMETSPSLVQGLALMQAAAGPDGDKILKGIADAEESRRKALLFPDAARTAAAGATKAEAEAVTAQVTATNAPEMALAALEKARGDAKTAAIAGKFAESKAIAELNLNAAQIKALAEDTAIKRQNVAIAATNAATARAGNDLKRQELQLKLNELVDKRDSAVREKVAQAEQGAFNIDNMMNTIERIKRNPALDAVIGPLEGGALFPQTVMGMQPFTASADDRADAIALIETLGSQAFLSQIPLIKGMGHLSNAEGDKLQSAFQNLTRKQSEKQFRATLDEATRLLNKARGNIAKSAGIELPKPDTPAAPGAKPPLSSFMRP